MDSSEKIAERKERRQAMFNAIACRYDLLNHLLSLGVDCYWRRRALARTRVGRPRCVLDMATGTGDFALEAIRLNPDRVIGTDVALNMVRLGVSKVARRATRVSTLFIGGDAESLPLRQGSFDLVTVAFGVRNFGSLAAGLEQAWAVLEPGGELLVLEFSEPTGSIFNRVYRIYFNHILPLVGGLISGNRSAYNYLPRSVASFPQGQAFLDLMRAAGFGRLIATPLTFGIAHIYQGLKLVD